MVGAQFWFPYFQFNISLVFPCLCTEIFDFLTITLENTNASAAAADRSCNKRPTAAKGKQKL